MNTQDMEYFDSKFKPITDDISSIKERLTKIETEESVKRYRRKTRIHLITLWCAIGTLLITVIVYLRPVI